MADLRAMFGVGGGSTKPVKTGTATSTTTPTFLNQELVDQLTQAFSGLVGGTAPSYLDFVNNPTESPIFQNALSGLLASLQPEEQQSRNALTDEFRAAGGLRGSAYGNAAGTLEGEILRNQQVTASDLLAKMFPEIADALFAPSGNTASLLNALKGETTTSTSNTFGADKSPVGGGFGRLPSNAPRGPALPIGVF